MNPHRPDLAEVTIETQPDVLRLVSGNAGCMVIFSDGERIDFGVFSTSAIDEDRQEHGGYWNDMGDVVLDDKDGLLEGAVPPTHTYCDTQPPSGCSIDSGRAL